VYVGGTAALYRFRPSVGASSLEDVEALAGLTSTHLVYETLLAGAQVFTINDTSSSGTERLWRISPDGVTWQLDNFASFATNPSDTFRSAAYDPLTDRIYMLTDEATSGT